MEKPNIIYILADDLGYGDVSFNNEKCPFKTKNFDSIGENGIRFTDAHSSSAVCSPSRYSILTGRYDFRSELKENVLKGFTGHLIEKGRTTVAHLLQKEGYSTHAIGKWHLGMDFATKEGVSEIPDVFVPDCIDYDGVIKNTPLDCGFDSFYGISASLNMPPFCYIKDRHFTHKPDHISSAHCPKSDMQHFIDGPTAPDFKQNQVLDHLSDKVLSQIEECKDEKFFIYYAMTAPHAPIFPAPEFIGKSHTNLYGDFVLHCDDVIGRIIAKLKELHLYDNTLLILTSDNGCSAKADYDDLLRKGHNPSYIYRGKKADIWEGGHRIPLLIQWPQVLEKNVTSNSLVCLGDFMRTLADYFHIELKDNEGEDSVSILPILQGDYKKEVRTELIHHAFDGSLAIRKGKWKLEMCPGSGGWGSFPHNDTPEVDGLPLIQLYDLEKDIGETTNVWEEYPDVVEELKALLVKEIKAGRSTLGQAQNNDGRAVWHAIDWLNSYAGFAD